LFPRLVVSKYKFNLTNEQWDTLYKFTSEEFQKTQNCTRRVGKNSFYGLEISWVKENILHNHLELDFLKKLFLEAVHHYFDTVHNVEIPALTKFMISDSWFVTARDHGIDEPYFPTAIHNHAFSICSGVFYIDDSDHGTLMYSDPIKPPHWPFVWGGKNAKYKSDLTKQEVDEKLIKSEKGTLILFPGETKHSSTVVRGAPDRRAIAFNVWPVGEVSDQENARLSTEADTLSDHRIFGNKLASLQDFQGDNS
jgi:hypothetical protein